MTKPSFMRNMLVKFFIFCVLALGLRFAYVVIIRGESCDLGDFCFFSLHENLEVVTNGFIGQLANLSFPTNSANVVRHSNTAQAKPKKLLPDLWSTEDFQTAARFFSAVFQDLISEGFLSSNSKTLCVETEKGTDVYALKELGVSDSIGVFKKGLKPLVISGQAIKLPFKDDTFDFVFSGGAMIEKAKTPVAFAMEVARTLKPEGFLVIHTGYRDTYSFNSLLDLFNCCGLMKSRKVDGFDPNMPLIHETVMKKEYTVSHLVEEFHDDSINKCSVPGYKRELIHKAENLIIEEPKKPWITLKKNILNVKYLPSTADISFKERYVYVDVGSRSYGSSIVSWFKKQYPKHNRTFEIFAIEADKHFHEEYRSKKGVTLLPYAAWVRNESLVFEISHTPGDEDVVKGRGMGRIQPVQSSSGSGSADHLDDIQGFDFAEWLKSTVSEKDFVVMKMDVEGTEFDLIPRLFETGAICLIDELFLECHYNRWQRCCPGERSTKYQKTYSQCLELFTSLRESGVLVHQWW